MTRNYLPGTCYTCKKCLYCFKNLQVETCKCKKTIKPKRKSKPKSGQPIYPRLFKPSQCLSVANKFLFSANTKFQYNSDFDREFSFTFCSTCNSKFQCLKDKDKLAKKLPKIPAKKMDIDSTFDIEDIPSPEFVDEEYKILRRLNCI